MKIAKNDFIMQNKVFVYLALATSAVLAIPLIAMKFEWVKPDPSNPLDQGVSWSLMDFVFMGFLLYGAGLLFILIARVTPQKFRLLIGLSVVTVFLLAWAHLAVGITDMWQLGGS